MPKYKYKFCDGTVNEIEVTDEQYALLKAMDEQERQNNRRQRRQNVSLARCKNIAKDDSADNGG